MGGYATNPDNNAASEITGSGTPNTIVMFTSAQVVGDSKITQNAAGTSITFAPGTASSGNITCFTFTPATNTGQGAGVETPGFVYSTVTRTWAAGAITTQREFRLGAPTYAFASSSTITNAFTFFAARPIAGTNATITNTWAIGTQGSIYVSGAAVTSGAQTLALFEQSANTGQTASTEISGFKMTGSSRQWATGAITTQRETYFSTTTYTAVGASVITNAYGFYVEAPTASTNITITNNWGLGVSGNAAFSSSIYIGSLTTSPANSFCTIVAGTTAKSQINLVPGVAPSSPVDGDIYYINTADRLMFFKNATACEVISASAVTTEALVSDTTLTVTFNGTTYKLLARA